MAGDVRAEGDPDGESRGFDAAKPNAARIYDYLLGGKEHFAADRRAAGQLLTMLPDAALAARANRAFLAAAVGHVARRGIGQYVDIGAGLPTSPNVHECARAAVADARVAYVDNDLIAVTHARALLATDERVIVVNGDARKPETILGDPELGMLIDFRAPVCVLFVSMLHFLTAGEADAIVAAFRERMAPGSYLVISAGHSDDDDAALGEQVRAVYGGTTALTGRTAAEIAAYFDGFDLEPPGLVPVTEWPVHELGARHRAPLQQALLPQAPPAVAKATMLAGIGRKSG
jgi:O-methyltransferase involved in polyketide biosynthesis